MRGKGVQVLVVGAGIAGLAAARTLRDWGATVEIVDRHPKPPEEGTGLYLPGNAARALAAIGGRYRIPERAVHIRRQRTADRHGRLLFEDDVDDLWHGVGPCVALPRADLHRLLLSGIDDIPVRWGHGPQTIALDNRGVHRGAAVTIGGLSDHYDLVLSSDGVHSTVRHLAFGPETVKPVGQHARWFVVPGSGQPGTWSVLLGSDSAGLTIPIGEGQVYCYTDGPIEDRRSLRELLAGYAEPVPSLLDALDTIGGESAVQAGPVEEVLLDSWSHGTVVLIGDAAHASTPNMAQGAAMALEDAIVLTECLTTSAGITEALTAFEHRRRPGTDWVRAQTHRRDSARSLPLTIRNMILTHFGDASSAPTTASFASSRDS